MNCLLVCKYGQVCDRLQYILNNIYKNDYNTYTRVSDAFTAKTQLRDKDIIIVDYELEGNETGLELLYYIKNSISLNNIRVIFICMPDMKMEMNDCLLYGYEYWFNIISKGCTENELKEALK